MQDRSNSLSCPSGMIQDPQYYADQCIREHNIPAISLAIWHRGLLHKAASGVLNLNTEVEATTDSIFQIGSITKVMTASLIMQLVDEGKVDLDMPVKHYLRDFMIANVAATNSITIRHLLSHTSGMAGDFFPNDLDQQGNLIARYVDRCSLLPLAHPVGRYFSYSNSAFAVAGRLIEVVRGMSWYQVMKEYLFQPLGMTHAIADPLDMIRFRSAVGHVRSNESADWTLPDRAYLTVGQAPAGTTPAMTAENLLTFARAHLNQGMTNSGERWLSVDAVEVMQAPQIELPRMSQVNRKNFGLGWGLSEHLSTGIKTLSHSGAARGCMSMLQIIPEQETAFVVLINGFNPVAIEAISRNLLADLAGIDIKEPPLAEPTILSVSNTQDLTRCVGSYDSMDTRIDITLHGDQLQAEILYKIDPLPPQTLQLIPIEGNCFGVKTVTGEQGPNLAFVYEKESEKPTYIFNGGRLSCRLATTAEQNPKMTEA